MKLLELYNNNKENFEEMRLNEFFDPKTNIRTFKGRLILDFEISEDEYRLLEAAMNERKINAMYRGKDGRS